DDEEKDGKEDEFWEEVHEFMGNFMLVLIFLHIAGVVVSSRLHGENLVKAMIDGRKRIS
ncbi:MAG TPA: cytochrome B, partial [Gammaproteobacteria bacterium]|nr:cytochrome B [Gammaproteobacteria bacterium]